MALRGQLNLEKGIAPANFFTAAPLNRLTPSLCGTHEPDAYPLREDW